MPPKPHVIIGGEFHCKVFECEFRVYDAGIKDVGNGSTSLGTGASINRFTTWVDYKGTERRLLLAASCPVFQKQTKYQNRALSLSFAFASY